MEAGNCREQSNPVHHCCKILALLHITFLLLLKPSPYLSLIYFQGNDRDFARFFVLETVGEFVCWHLSCSVFLFPTHYCLCSIPFLLRFHSHRILLTSSLSIHMTFPIFNSNDTARVPYFAYLSVLHLRETFGQRTTDGTATGEEMSDRMRTHYAEADNELHHLLIMESLGGNSNIVDRVLAQTMAFGYYWYVIVVYFLSEPAAYHLSELIEDHAFNTYDGFLKNHGDRLKKMPVPEIANKYYELDNPFLFDLFCTVKEMGTDGTFSTRRPKLESLYDVFVNVRDDER
jgi:hypothetical protein